MYVVKIRSARSISDFFFGIATAMIVSGLTSNFDNSVSIYFKSLQGNERVDALMIGDVSTVISSLR